jgi:hypothetical protein
MSLSEDDVKRSAPTDRPYKLFDGQGLYLLVNPNGSKYWRLKYRHLKKEKVLTLGAYPEVGLKPARDLRDEARAHLADNRDPGVIKREGIAAAIASAPKRLSIDNDGALTFHVGTRCVVLTPQETVQLRAFLDATRAVTTEQQPCP